MPKIILPVETNFLLFYDLENDRAFFTSLSMFNLFEENVNVEFLTALTQSLFVAFNSMSPYLKNRLYFTLLSDENSFI